MARKSFLVLTLVSVLLLAQLVPAVPYNTTDPDLVEQSADDQYPNANLSEYDLMYEEELDDDFDTFAEEDILNGTTHHFERRALYKGRGKLLQRKSAFTYYWLAQQKDYKGGKVDTWVKSCKGKNIAKVNKKYANALKMEGSGFVGKSIVNLGDCSCKGFKCFEVLDKKKFPFGLTSSGTALKPFISIAANDLKKGSKIYVPQLDGWKLPGTKLRHNGCLEVEDKSWSFSKRHIDFFVMSVDYYHSLDRSHRITKVDIYAGGKCKLLKYLK
ncbi:hypothetical protein BC936DRAFT_142489 [Jimgerdemannia flammicorona]|uniref:Uncharacterized protein n=2 Tax=Jimgerdemannia flammicorona TaxID=994334 RepID=A0A433QI36_9FUNG|nr:hypothetical protein BC936DRAFT_142489 [Jimgerdemannia flammicorona]RUS29429.1 hypothetical protein BC938DRAFT_480677 [Jimgerdemannia flammicorona]